MAYLEIRNACVHYPVRNTWGTTGEFVRAVDDVSLSLEKGSILGLVGESGCGKSTLSRAIMQLQPLTSGSIVLNGTNLSRLSKAEVRRRRPDFQICHARILPDLTRPWQIKNASELNSDALVK